MRNTPGGNPGIFLTVYDCVSQDGITSTGRIAHVVTDVAAQRVTVRRVRCRLCDTRDVVPLWERLDMGNTPGGNPKKILEWA
jgi:hypothetical protein